MVGGEFRVFLCCHLEPSLAMTVSAGGMFIDSGWEKCLDDLKIIAKGCSRLFSDTVNTATFLFFQVFRCFGMMVKDNAIRKDEQHEHKLHQEVRIVPILDTFQG